MYITNVIVFFSGILLKKNIFNYKGMFFHRWHTVKYFNYAFIIESSRNYHGIPFLDFYEQTTGRSVTKAWLPDLKKKHPNIDQLSHDQLQWSLQVLQKFGICALEAIHNPHVFVMNPISVDNYGSILKECGFVKILPQYIVKYHTLVKSRTIARLKKEGLLNEHLILEKVLQDCLQDMPDDCKSLIQFADSETSILSVRMSVLERYLTWKLSITTEDFQKYCRNYLPLKHKPMSDIQEALDLAENDIKFHKDDIRRNGFIIASDPINTKLIIKKVPSLAGLDIREAIKIEPAILKNNYNALIKIRDLLEEYRISKEAQIRCLKVYCMRPSTVQERLEELRSLKEYQILHTNPRVLSMVVHKNKMMTRLSKIQEAKKQCYSLNHLVSSSKVFNNYITSFGNKVCGRDMAILICSSLKVSTGNGIKEYKPSSPLVKKVLTQLRRHKYWLHSALHVIAENIEYLKKYFDDETIFNNCHLLLYPICEIEEYLQLLLKLRDEGRPSPHKAQADHCYHSVNCSVLTDNHILSLVLYEIEKRYHFSGDGIWARQDGVKLDNKVAS